MIEETLKLQFRALLPDGRYFEQGDQFLNSFFRRAAGFIKWGGEFDKDVSECHEKYLDKPLEDYLEIKIGEEWIKCKY